MQTFTTTFKMTNIKGAYVETRDSDNGHSSHDNVQLDDPMMSNEGRRVLEIIFYVTLTGTISVFGSVANIINIVIFSKQGFHDSVNISLYGLAVSDLCSLLPLVWMSICFNPLFQYSDIQFDSIQVQYLTAGWPHGCFVWITSWITAVITFERCVCIAIPMKVKDIITRKRTFFTIVFIFIVMITIASPNFFFTYFKPSFHIGRNKTLVGLSYSTDGQKVETFSFVINVVVQFSAVFIVIMCTATLIHNLAVKSRWRVSATLVLPFIKSDLISLRDKRVMKMVTFIACIFIISFLPTTVNLIMMISFPFDYTIYGRYHNSYHVSWAILNIIEAVNGSINIILYYNMSSKFRINFDKLFNKGSVGVNNK